MLTACHRKPCTYRSPFSTPAVCSESLRSPSTGRGSPSAAPAGLAPTQSGRPPCGEPGTVPPPAAPSFEGRIQGSPRRAPRTKQHTRHGVSGGHGSYRDLQTHRHQPKPAGPDTARSFTGGQARTAMPCTRSPAAVPRCLCPRPEDPGVSGDASRENLPPAFQPGSGCEMGESASPSPSPSLQSTSRRSWTNTWRGSQK